MPWDVFADVLRMTQRVESALIYTLVRFIFSLVSNLFETSVVIYLNAVLALMFYDLRRLSLRFDDRLNVVKSLTYISRLFQKFATLVLTQAIIRSVQPSDVQNINVFAQIQCLTVSLCLLIILTVLPDRARDSEDGQQFMRLVLYMFTSNTEFVIQRVSFGWTLPFLSAAGFFALYHMSHLNGNHGPVLLVLSRAFTLSLTNMMILTSWTVQLSSTDRISQMTQLVSLLVLFDAISHVFEQFEAMRDYAVWQGASQIYNMLEIDGVSSSIVITSALFGIMVVQASRRYFMSSDAIVELLLLLVINEVLGQVQNMIDSIHTNDTAIIVTIWLIIIETILLIMKNAG